MSFRKISINTYLMLIVGLAVVAGAGCKSAEERRKAKTFTTLWLHLEAPGGMIDTNHIIRVSIAGTSVLAQSRPFLTEDFISKADVVNTPAGGHALRVEFDDHGKLVLDTVTTANLNRRILIYGSFGYRARSKKQQAKYTKTRWLAAPLVGRRITDGAIVFTPDVTDEELDELVLGLNNTAKENKKPWVF